MDYVVGSVAALITGNVTPSRPRLMKRALTPTKHQPSPNVTPKSEFVEDRSIFLSPSVQKKKAIVKKSPKRIFQNPDLETTENSEGNLSLTSPKADKVKKHLKDELGGDHVINKSMTNPKSPVNKVNNKRDSTSTVESKITVTEQGVNECTPKKKKKKHSSGPEVADSVSAEPTDNVSMEEPTSTTKSPKKRKQRRKSVVDTENNTIEIVKEPETPIFDKSPTKQKNKLDVETPIINKSPTKQKNQIDDNNTESTKSNEVTESSNNNTPKKKNKRQKKKKAKSEVGAGKSEKADGESAETNKENIQQEKPKKKNKKRKSKGQQNKSQVKETKNEETETKDKIEVDDIESKNAVNPNAITDKESDSEHESDNEIESENEEINKKVLESEKTAETSDEEEEEQPQKAKKKEVEKKVGDGEERSTEEEIKRTLFVGNVPFSVKCKKEIKKIFSKHGQIETIRIRTVPIKDGRYTPKLALIKNELHPERTTVNVYIKYADEESIEKALAENNTLLNEHHLRVSRSSSTGAEHDPRCSVFIGNLPFAMEDEALRAKFENCGTIHSVRIIRDKKTNAGKGFGYVNFESKDGVELALALTEEDLTVKNRILRVKRCTQTTNKKKTAPIRNNQNNQQKSGFRGGNNQSSQRSDVRTGDNQMNQSRGGFVGRRNQGDRQRGGFTGGNNQGYQQRGGFTGGNNQGNQQRGGFASRKNQGDRQRGGFADGNNRSPQQRGGFNNFANQRNQSQKDEEGREGAHRRVMNKRKSQDGAGGGDGPPNKKQKDISQPKEKKSREEFVGMTAEKKKKRKFDKGQKKKKALSEILTK